MTAWDDDYLDEEVTAFIEFGADELGDFQFGYVYGSMDCREATRDGKTAIEWTWEGGDKADFTPLTGRGWAILDGNELHGEIFIHCGDDSEFVARRSKRAVKRKKGK